MGLLAYDPTRLAFLRRVMAATVDELCAVQCSDPEAVAAMRRVRTIRLDLAETWLPLVDRILSSPAMTSSARRDAGIRDLAGSLTFVMAQGYGWSVQRDPLTGEHTVTAEEARALGARLNSCDWAALATDASDLTWLAAQLALIGRDQSLSREFLANFREWAALCDQLARERALLVAGVPRRDSATVAQLDSVFAGLAAVRRQTPASSACDTAAAVVPQIEVMNPYSAALIVRHLHLDGLLLAEVTDLLLQRWVSLPRGLTIDGRPTTDTELGGPNTADLLLPLLLGDPEACAHYVALAARHPDTLFTTAADPDLAHRVLLLGTDPRQVPSSQAGEVIVTVLDHFASDRYECDAMCDGHDGTWPTFLVDLVAPWLLQLSPLNDEWRADAVRRRDLLAFVLTDDAALQRLIDTSSAATAALATSLVSRDGHTLEEFAALVGMLAELVVDERIGDEEQRRAAWDMMWSVVQVGTNFAPGGPLGGIAAGVAGDVAEWGTRAAFGAPDPADAATRAGEAADWTLTVAAATMTAALVHRWRGDGTLAGTGVPPPPQPDASADHPSLRFVEAFVMWRASLPGGPTGALAAEATAVAFAFVGPSGAGRHFAG